MATGENNDKVPLKLLVDERRNRVLAAEASKEFVDILLSFLTLPMGSIMRITGDQKIVENEVIGGIYRLYQSVQDLDDDNFPENACKSKSFLLNPMNPCAEFCKNLRVKIDNLSPQQYYRCCCGFRYISTAFCFGCHMYPEEKLLGFEHATAYEPSAGFVKARMKFIISDDLHLSLCYPSSLVQHLGNLGITDVVTQVTVMSVEAGIEEISSLLKCSLISKSPLTDVFLAKQVKSESLILPLPRDLPPPRSKTHESTASGQFSLKLVLRKSTNEILCAEASEDFVNFLFSFLIMPLGSVVKLLHGQTRFECVGNLHNSVEKLESKWLLIKKDSLLDAGVATPYKEKRDDALALCSKLRLWDVMGARLSLGQILFSGRFVKTDSSFLVSDNLVVKDLASTSCIDFLKEHNVPICDIEELMVTVGEAEALGILKASLTSSSALKNGLASLLMEEILVE